MSREQTNWHHLFGLMVQDFFMGTPCEVELERDLSVKSQFLDVLILHKTAELIDRVLPDGLEGQLVEHNLITFKSYHQPLDGWALDELLGHYVNFRKQISPSFDDLLPVERFRLFAVCARHPDGLAAQVTLTEVGEGVYEVVWGIRTIRIIVAGRLPQTRPNALLHLFSASPPLLEYGRRNCRIQSPQTSTLVADLFAGYDVEGLTVPITMEEYIRQAERRAVARASVEMRLEGLTPEQLLEKLTPEQRLEGVSPELIAEKLTPEAREKLRRLLNDPPSA